MSEIEKRGLNGSELDSVAGGYIETSSGYVFRDDEKKYIIDKLGKTGNGCFKWDGNHLIIVGSNWGEISNAINDINKVIASAPAAIRPGLKVDGMG